VSNEQICGRIRELIAALDRRQPRPHHVDEPAIAAQSAALRLRALSRLEELAGGDAADASCTPHLSRSRACG
jgi:hypothetical protein